MVEKNPQSPQSDLPFRAGDWINKQLKDDTVFVHAGVSPDPKTGAILTPVCMSTTFVQESVEQYLEKGYSYSRSGNPTVSAFEARVAAVENAVGAAAFGTGMAATTCVISAFMKSGEHCVMADCSYGGTNRIARVMFRDDMGMKFTFVDMTDPVNVRKAIIPGKTKLIFSETPANPLLKLVDIDAISAIAKEHGIVHVCDSTFATPVICRPIDHGADITLQSTTKYVPVIYLAKMSLGSMMDSIQALEELLPVHQKNIWTEYCSSATCRDLLCHRWLRSCSFNSARRCLFGFAASRRMQ
jgi:O-acetylhomoserine/O-acetylserine sulfhydrylase-like pyridoxal-dependent enzyme